MALINGRLIWPGEIRLSPNDDSHNESHWRAQNQDFGGAGAYDRDAGREANGMSASNLSDDTRLSNRQAWEFLGVSKATYYRNIYPRLITDPATRWLNGHPRFVQSQLEALLRSDRPIAQPAICSKSAQLTEATPRPKDRMSDHNVARPKPSNRRRPKPRKAVGATGQLVLLDFPEVP